MTVGNDIWRMTTIAYYSSLIRILKLSSFEQCVENGDNLKIFDIMLAVTFMKSGVSNVT